MKQTYNINADKVALAAATENKVDPAMAGA